jgi:[ribosomal protein S5]-alanine N-acetyltransferase
MPIPRITLIPITESLAEAIADERAFTAASGATLGAVAPLARGMVEQTLSFHRRIASPAEYGGFLAADAVSAQVIGGCGFKGGPDAHGDVEIAYGTFAPYEGLGYAKAMARALIRRAAASGAPNIIAHTLPELGASVAVLRGIGFRNVGTVISDPEDGPVWRWELPPEVADQYRR